MNRSRRNALSAYASDAASQHDAQRRLAFLLDRCVSPGGRIVASVYLSTPVSGEDN